MIIRMKNKNYNFKNIWIVSGNLKDAEAAILDMYSWSKWWEGLIDATITNPDVNVIGTKITAKWKSTFGYQLKTQLTITGYKPGEMIIFNSEGDLRGEGSWSFKALSDTETSMEIIWNVATQKAWMNLFGPLLKPAFIYAHNKLMNEGEAGFRAYVN